jgi:hypothetical protein
MHQKKCAALIPNRKSSILKITNFLQKLFK